MVTNLDVSVCLAQGHRDYMEDECLVQQDFVAVFDGHGGPSVSKYLRQNLFAHLQAILPRVVEYRKLEPSLVQQNEQEQEQQTEAEQEESITTASTTSSSNKNNLPEPTVQDYCVALRMALDTVDKEVQKINHWSYQGSTAVAAWLHYNTTSSSTSSTPTTDDTRTTTTTTTLIVANIGDSRAIVGRNGTTIPLTRDHKPDDPSETKRIEQAGGSVVWCGPRDSKTGQPLLEQGIYRVNGNLALSRAIGDRSERPAVTATPDLTYLQVLLPTTATPSTTTFDTVVDNMDSSSSSPTTTKEYVVLATDGLWDVFTNQEVVQVIDLLLDKVQPHQRPKIAEILVREALRRGAYDNITVIIVWLQVPPTTMPAEEEEKGTPASADPSSSKS